MQTHRLPPLVAAIVLLTAATTVRAKVSKDLFFSEVHNLPGN